MSWFSTLVTAVLTAAVGTVLSGYVANLAVRWYRISSFEGGSGYYVMFMALGGLVAGLVIGVVMSRIVAATAHPGFLKALGLSVMTMAALVGVIGGVGRLRADVPPTIDGEELMLMVEARWPATQKESPAATPGVSYLELGSVSGHVQRLSKRGALWKEDAHLVDGRWVVPGAVNLFTGRGEPSIQIALNDSVHEGFGLRMPASPGKSYFEWSEWYPRNGRNGPPMETGITYRFRVQKTSVPVRTEVIGGFEVSAIANGFQTEIPGGTNTLDPYARFVIKYRGQPLKLQGSADTDASATRFGMLALLPSEKPALLSYIDPSDGNSYCAMFVDDGAALQQHRVAACSNVIQAEELTTYRSRVEQVTSPKPARGRVDRHTYAQSSLLLFNGVVLNTKTLALYPITAQPNESYAISSVSSLGVSPDQHSFVQFHRSRESEGRELVAVIDFVRDSVYTLPIDVSRMRYAQFKDLTPDWLLHHFQWQRGADGVDRLSERPNFLPIPYHGEFAEEGEGKITYTIYGCGQPIRMALTEFLQKEFHAQREPVADDDYEYPMTIDGKRYHVTNIKGDVQYVSLSLMSSESASEAASTLIKRVGEKFNAVLATGRYDAEFVK